MDPRTVLLKSLEARRRRYRRDFNRARADFSEEAVHDLRVATRRLLAVLALLHTLTSDGDMKPLRRELKGQLDGLDHLRDAQVMLGEVVAHAEELPGLALFEQDLRARVDRQLEQARKTMGKMTFAATSNLNGRLLSLREWLRGQADVGDPLAVADAAYADVLSRRAAVDGAAPDSFHRLRVAFKKFRYTLEIVQPLVPGLEKAALQPLNDYQTMLGQVQDSRVLLQTMDQLAGNSETFPAAVREYYGQRLNAAISEALSGLGKAEAFWRASPQGHFPWETEP